MEKHLEIIFKVKVDSEDTRQAMYDRALSIIENINKNGMQSELIKVTDISPFDLNDWDGQGKYKRKEQ
jgi:hypothetical protein